MRHIDLLETFNGYKARCEACTEVYCTCCGGIVTTVKGNMTSELRNEIDTVLAEVTVEEFLSLGDWCQFIESINPRGVLSVIERESKNLDISNIKKIDRFLLKGRYFKHYSSSYKKILQDSITLSLDTSNESLIETIAIVLAGDIADNDEFLSLAMEKSKVNKNIHRVLYNNLRETVPEVRNFVGDGSTVSWW